MDCFNLTFKLTPNSYTLQEDSDMDSLTCLLDST